VKKASSVTYLVVTIVTLANAVCGMIACFFLIKYTLLRNTAEIFPEKYLTLVWLLVFLGGIFDLLDGIISRLTGTTSEFGKELDSLADSVSYGIVPAFIIALLNSFTAHPYWEIFSWFCAIFYLSCVLLRLARFNVEALPGQKYHFEFKGLSSPGATGVIGAILILFIGLQDGNILFTRKLWELFSKSAVIQFSDHLIPTLPFVGLLLGFLMISNMKSIHIDRFLYFFKGKGAFHYLIYILIAFLLIVLFREIAFALFFLCCFFYAPILHFSDLLKKK